MPKPSEWKTLAGSVVQKRMPWGGLLTVWEGPRGRSYTCEFSSGSFLSSFGFSEQTREQIVQHCLEGEAKDHADHGFPEKVERERLERIGRWEDEKRAHDNYPTALGLLRRVLGHRATDEEIRAFLDYDAALQKVGEAKVEKERTRKSCTD